MAGAPIDTTLRLTLREGSIYYFTDRSLTSAEPHYFIVVNSNPLKQQFLLLSVVTSQIDSVKLRRKACPETLVELDPQNCEALKKPSIVDCNDLKCVPLADFNERYVRKDIRCCDKDLSVNLRKALRKAIHASKILADEFKVLVEKP